MKVIKALSRITTSLMSRLPARVSRQQVETTRLVMTLLVRDEIDIVRQNIEFHLRHGVDFIIATDNGSVDGTRDVLLAYQDKGVLRLIDEPAKTHEQALWVNRMGELAAKEYQADLIFHCDADEFWNPEDGNIKTSFLKAKPADVLRVKALNVVLEDRNGDEEFPKDAIYSIVRPTRRNAVAQVSDNRYLRRSHRKVIYHLRNGYLPVSAGNHRIAHPPVGLRQCKSSRITIYHYPCRGKAHFYRKVANGGSALAAGAKATEGTGVHWRKWYTALQSGELEKEYQSMVLKPDAAQQLIKMRVVRRGNRLADDVSPNQIRRTVDVS